MKNREQPNHRGYDLAKQFSMLVSFIGVLLLIGHLAGQVREGSASAWSLIAGAACLIFGCLFTLLFVICIRLQRIEARISGEPVSVAPDVKAAADRETGS